MSLQVVFELNYQLLRDLTDKLDLKRSSTLYLKLKNLEIWDVGNIKLKRSIFIVANNYLINYLIILKVKINKNLEYRFKRACDESKLLNNQQFDIMHLAALSYSPLT